MSTAILLHYYEKYVLGKKDYPEWYIRQPLK
jgi:hypothetical protein